MQHLSANSRRTPVRSRGSEGKLILCKIFRIQSGQLRW
jgi:hypothetical protein